MSLALMEIRTLIPSTFLRHRSALRAIGLNEHRFDLFCHHFQSVFAILGRR